MEPAYNIKHSMHDFLLSKSYNGITASEIDATNFQNIIRDAEKKDPQTTYKSVDISSKLGEPIMKKE